MLTTSSRTSRRAPVPVPRLRCSRIRARRRRAAPAAGAPSSGFPRVLQHLVVAVGVARGQDRPSADPAPDPHRLLRPVVPDVQRAAESADRRCRRCRRSSAPASCRPRVRAGCRRSRGDRSHEVTATAGHDVAGEVAVLEIPQQLHHRGIGARLVGPLQRRMLRSAKNRTQWPRVPRRSSIRAATVTAPASTFRSLSSPW